MTPLLLASLAPFAVAAAPDAAATTALTGAWRLAEARPVVQTRVDAAIDGMLAPFNIVIRKIAQPRLAEAATFCDTYDTTLTTTTFRLSCDGRGFVDVPFDQPPLVGTTPKGRPYSVTGTWKDGAVVLSFSGDEGSQIVRYHAENGALLVEKTLLVERLETQLSWPMRYTRP